MSTLINSFEAGPPHDQDRLGGQCERKSVAEYINGMSDTIHIIYTDSGWNHEVSHR